MSKALRVLIVEDSEDDAMLLVQELRRDGWEVTHERVDTGAAMLTALDKNEWDLIIADYSMPNFNGMAALALANRRSSDLPFILISGVVGEETAVKAMKAGADDYVSKGNLSRLVFVVERELLRAAMRRQAQAVEQQLRQRETHLADALQRAKVGTWHLDISTDTAVWSDEARRILGFAAEQETSSFEELLARLNEHGRNHLTGLLHQADANQFAQDFQLIRPDGALQFIHLRGDILRDDNMAPFEALGMIQDITEQKRAQAELSDQHARFKTTLASIGDGVIVTDPESRITFMNTTAEQLSGWSLQDALQMHLMDVFNIVDENSSRAVPSPVAKALCDGAVIALRDHTSLMARDGTERPIDGSAAPIMDDAGRTVGVVLVFRDITSRRKIEHAVEISEVRYRRLFERANDGILILDAQTAKVLEVNRFVIDLLGYPREYFLGKELWEMGIFKDAEGSRTAMETLQRLGRIRYEDLLLEHKDGRHIPVEFVSNIYREGRLSVIQCNIRDISERKRAEAELATAMVQAEAANRSKSEFLANMSHEIRTPTNAILGFADMVLHKNQDKAGRIECAQIIRRNALHLLELINEILDLSKIEAGKMMVERVSCDLPALLSEIISLMRPRAVEKGLEFAVTFQGPIPRLIKSDPMRLRQILVNLLGNAIKFTASGKIEVRVTEGVDDSNIMLRVDVIDSGIGMTQEQLQRLFRPFTQGDESITRKFGGTGLGLTISKQLAMLLNGDITVTSELGKGSAFSLKIDGGPTAGVERLQDLTDATLPANVDEGAHPNIRLNGRILLAEDGRDNQRLLRMQLGDAGAELVIAENGRIAVELATTQQFDLILMDMQMPVMDGYAATAELRRRGMTLPIIALTAHAMAEDRNRCIASGCSAYLSKPVDEEVLLKTVNLHLGKDASTMPIENAKPSIAATAPASHTADDSGRIRSSLADNPRILQILPEFVDGLPGEVRKMIDLLERNDLAALKQVVHQLLGAAGGYGFDPVTEPAAKAEESIKSGKVLEEVTAQIHSLIEVIRRIDGYDESKTPAAEQAAK